MKQDYYGQEKSKRYVTPMVGAPKFVTKHYIWQVGAKKLANLALPNY